MFDVAELKRLLMVENIKNYVNFRVKVIERALENK